MKNQVAARMTARTCSFILAGTNRMLRMPGITMRIALIFSGCSGCRIQAKKMADGYDKREKIKRDKKGNYFSHYACSPMELKTI